MTHAHHWKLTTPQNGITAGVCKTCGADREWIEPHLDLWVRTQDLPARGGEVIPGGRGRLRTFMEMTPINEVVW